MAPRLPKNVQARAIIRPSLSSRQNFYCWKGVPRPESSHVCSFSFRPALSLSRSRSLLSPNSVSVFPEPLFFLGAGRCHGGAVRRESRPVRPRLRGGDATVLRARRGTAVSGDADRCSSETTGGTHLFPTSHGRSLKKEKRETALQYAPQATLSIITATWRVMAL